MREVLNHYAAKIDSSEILGKLGLEPQKYILVSMHREENVDYADKLSELLRALEMLAEQFKYPIVVSTHPRTQKRIDSLGYKNETGLIQFLKPFGFSDYNLLQKKAFCVVSDSGTISEESSILEFPAVTIRNALERPEALDAGCITMTGTYPDRIVDCVGAVTRQFAEGAPIECPVDYQVENTSQRVVRLILGTAKLAHRWQGIENLEKA